MPVNADAIGIESCSLTLAQKVRVSKKAEVVSPLLDRSGAFIQGATIGGDIEFSIEGKGDLPNTLTIGGSDPDIDQFSAGVTIISDVEESEEQKDWNGWTVNGENFPAAE
ncbi:MAG: hypothetical protein JNJ83_10965 [Verrucomicrobiaceae bacterium]|nr:hypothetical protein [Verrucomicrobiaceae bacterium]